jgi:hypothetical protein
MKKFPQHPKSACFTKRNNKPKIDIEYIPHKRKMEYLSILHSNPSTGIMFILYLLSFKVKSVTVAGFDFYESLYLHKSNDSLLKQINDNKIGNHNPKVQFEYFKKCMKHEKRFIPVGRLKKKLGY